MATQTGSIDLTATNGVKLMAEAGFENIEGNYATKAELDVQADRIGMVVANSDASSSLQLTADAMTYIGNNVTIKGTDGTTTAISGGRIQANSLSIGALDSAAQSATLNSNISVGGRNYILDSAGTLVSCLGSAAGSRKEYQFLNVGQSYMDIPHGTQVTISFDLYMTVNTANPTILVYNTNTNRKGPKAFSYTPVGNGTSVGVTKSFTATAGSVIDERVSVTGYINDRETATESDNFLEFYSNYGSSNWFSISNLKLEKGNKATDWTPAPEDMASSADSVEFIAGTQTAATNAWTGVTKDASLSTGKMIAYYLPYAGTSSAATLNLTLSGGGTTGAKNVKFNSNNSAANNVTTHYGAGSIIYMTYDGTYWRVAAGYYDTGGINNARYRTQNPNAIKASEAITASHIICGTSSGYKNIAAGVTFDLSYPLLYVTSAIESGSTGTDNYLTYNGVNVANNGSITGATSNAIVFLKGTVSGNTFAIAASGFITCTVPNSDDGYAYIPLGILYNGTNGIYFSTSKDLYAYKDGAFGPVSIREASAAAKTATSYVTDIDSNGITVHPSRSDYATNGGRAVINANGLTIYLGSDDVASYGASARIGKANSDRVTVDSTNGITIYKGNSKRLQTTANGIDVYGSDGTTSIASFGSTVVLASENDNHLVLDGDSLEFLDQGDNRLFYIDPYDGDGIPEDSSVTLSTDSGWFVVDAGGLAYLRVGSDDIEMLVKKGNASQTALYASGSEVGVHQPLYAYAGATATYQLLAEGTQNTIALRANTVGHRGLYDLTNDEWILYRDGSNDNLVIKFLSSNFDIDAAVALSGSTSISANGVQTGTTNITKSGWVPVAVAGVNVNSHWAATVRWYLSARGSGTGTISWAVHNMSGTAAITPTVTFYVLWARE